MLSKQGTRRQKGENKGEQNNACISLFSKQQGVTQHPNQYLIKITLPLGQAGAAGASGGEGQGISYDAYESEVCITLS